MRNVLTAGFMALSLCALPVLAQQAATVTNVTNNSEPGKYSTADVVKASVLVTAVDAPTRTLTLKDAKGQTTKLVAGDEVKNFAQIKKGDEVVVAYVRALTLELKKGNQPLEHNESVGAVRAEPGQKPQGAVAKQVHVTSDVVAVDPKGMTITLKGPSGDVVTLPVKNAEHFKVVKVGDQVEATYTEAVAISVEPAPKKK